MNKILLTSLCLAAAMSFTGCVGEEEDIFDNLAPVRLDQAAETYTERLAAATGGWAMEYYPTTELEAPKGLGYLLLTKFYPNQSVDVAMNNAFTTPANTYQIDTSSWEVITDNGPVLTFNTYNKCLHVFSSPEDVPSTATDETGLGLEGDYEFVMIDVPEGGDFVMLKGKKRGTYVRLSRLDEGTDFEAYLDSVQAFRDRMFPASSPNVCVLSVGDSLMRMASASSGIANIYPYDGDAIYDESYHPFLVTRRGGAYYLRFREALNAPDGTTEQEFMYDASRDLFTGVGNPENILEGEYPGTFFTYSMDADNRSWRLQRTSVMSADVQAAYEAVRTEMAKSQYTLNYIQFTQSDDGIVCNVNCKVRTSTTDVPFSFNVSTTQEGGSLVYAGPATDVAATVADTFPSIVGLMEALSGENFTISAGTTRFNMSTLRFASADGKEFILSII